MPEERTAVQDEFGSAFTPDYPDVVAAGSLLAALQAEADRAGYALAFEHVLPQVLPPEGLRVAAQAAAGDRLARVVLTLGGRGFHLGHRIEHRTVAAGRTPDLASAAAAVHDWLQGTEVGELTARRPFLRDLERSAPNPADDTVADRWQQLRTAPAAPRNFRLRELVEAAYREPRLRVLSPGLSHHWLRLRRSADRPDYSGLPLARPLGGGRFEVRTADGVLQEADGAAGAVALLLAALPEDLPAP
ncbi:DUF6193 family natural product biosynthesis protein [Kitasatospora sp. NPDC059571]|uniref:DUF6193 family natural product biosynthesis protein n=1 Tax=Kitasatospora sp. NPDC059571 TaxID=3346871 RepID=UPI0036A975AA